MLRRTWDREFVEFDFHVLWLVLPYYFAPVVAGGGVDREREMHRTTPHHHTDISLSRSTPPPATTGAK